MPSVTAVIPSVTSLVSDVSGVVSKVSGDLVSVDYSNDNVPALSDSASGGGIRCVSEVIAGDEEAVNSLCDSLSDKMTISSSGASSSGVSSRGNSRTVGNFNIFWIHVHCLFSFL